MNESKLIDFKSEEKEILLSIFNQFPTIDNWIASIVENYIYSYIEEVEEVKPFMLSFYPFTPSNPSIKNSNKMDSNFTQLVIRYRMRFDQKDGEFKTYFINGVLKSEMNYKNDKLNGEYKEYFTNGQLAESVMYKNGKRNGLAVRWYYNSLYHLNGKSKVCYKHEYKDGELVQTDKKEEKKEDKKEDNKEDKKEDRSKKMKWTHYYNSVL